MELRLIRSATLRLAYGSQHLLIDPMLGVRDSTRPLGGVPGRNPTVDLPCSVGEVIDGVDAVVVSHQHPDHFDDAATGVVPRYLPVFCQAGDGEAMRDRGFDEVIELDATVTWRGIEITPTDGTHGRGPIGERMGGVVGLLLRADGEPTVYWAGDTVLCPPVLDVIDQEHPDVVITHSGGAAYDGTKIIMDVADTIDVAQAAPWATIVAVHLEALTHCPITRDQLRNAADGASIESARLLIPADGETIPLRPVRRLT